LAKSSSRSTQNKTSAQLQTGRQKSAITQERKLAVIAFAFSGMAALIYEVVWARELSLVFGSTVYAVSMMLATFMSGLSLGGFLGGKWADKSKNLLALFGKLELGIAIFGLLTIPLIQVLPTLYFFIYNTLKPGFYLFFFFQLLLSFLIMLIPTTFMGATFPVVAKINTASVEELGNDVGNVYSVNTIGSILGSMSAGFLLIPLIGVKGTTLVAAGLNLLISVSMILVSKSAFGKRLLVTGSAVLVAVGVLASTTHEPAIAHNFYRIADYQTYDEYKEYIKNVKTLFFADDLHGRVTVFEVPGGERSLANDGKVEGSSTEYDKQVMSLFGLLPMACADNPKSALVIGLGTGYTAYATLAAGNAQVDIAEINRAVLDASKFFVGDSIEKNPRARFYVNDARNFLYTSDKKYDVVTSEPSYPVSTHISPLFTKEFFELVSEHLNDGGVYCQWIPRYIMRDDDMLMMFKTFTSVFPNTYVWGQNFGANQAQDVLMIGVKGNTKLDVEDINERIRKSGFEKLGLRNLDFSFYADPSTLQGLAQGTLSDGRPIPMNTDDRPLLEFIAPKNHIEFFRQDTGAFF